MSLHKRAPPLEGLGRPFFLILHLIATLSLYSGGVVIFYFLTPNNTYDCMNVNYVTAETLEKMKEELHQMKTVDRPAASRAIAEAREKGDLKENAEYDAAKEAQGLLEAKIKSMEGTLAITRIVNEDSIDTSKVSILTRVSITNIATKKTMVYQLVGEQEADLKAGKISITSPIGRGLLGKAVGEVAEVKAPNGTLKFKVEDITI